MNPTNYYSITTKRFVLRCKHREWLDSTQELYNAVMKFYYELFLDQEDVWELHSHQVSRTLEVMTIVGRDKQPVRYPLPYQRLPLYFRRAAINAAIAAGKSYLSLPEPKKPAVQFHKSVTFYKGNYREFTDSAITLRVWTGQEWRWMRCTLSGNQFPEDSERLSPSVVIKGKEVFLTVPVREKVPDGRKAMERMKADVRICVVQFSNTNALAACLFMNEKGEKQDVFFLRGGKDYASRCSRLVSKIEKSEASTGGCREGQANRKYWTKLKNISDNFSNSISRQIINICINHGTEIIVLPKYSDQYQRLIMLHAKNWSPLQLTSRIRNQLAYKAWREGILILEVDASHTSSVCAKCGAPVRREQDMVLCPNGHRGSRVLNTAFNLGRKCLASFGKQVS